MIGRVIDAETMERREERHERRVYLHACIAWGFQMLKVLKFSGKPLVAVEMPNKGSARSDFSFRKHGSK